MSIEDKHFEVKPGTARNVQAVGMYPGDEYEIHYLTGFPGCNPNDMDFVPYYEDGRLVMLDESHNPLTLWRPGFYKVVPLSEMNERADVLVSDPYQIHVNAGINNVAVA